jgi:hypothetical protein
MNIAIGGDSWGVREWGNIELHRGLWQYFEEDGHEVTMAAIAGSGNFENVSHFFNVISTPLIKYDYIFWFQSDPIRDLRPYDDLGTKIKSYDDLLNESEILLDKVYLLLNSVGKKVYCMGGCGKLNLKLMSKYKNLEPFIESVTEFLLGDYIHPKIWVSLCWSEVLHRFDTITLDKLLEEKNKQLPLNENEKYREYFCPDGNHPNRKAHQVLYNYIFEKLINYGK